MNVKVPNRKALPNGKLVQVSTCVSDGGVIVEDGSAMILT